MEKTVERVNGARQELETSRLVEELCEHFRVDEICNLICLALGSPELSSAARFQLALVDCLVKRLQLDPSKVFLYDPVFTKIDKQLLDTLGYRIELLESAVKNSEHSSKVLYFLPHASLELTEQVVSQYSPHILLANDVVAHTDRLTKRKLFETYRTLSYMTLLLDSPSPETGFKTVTKNRKNKRAYVEPELDYSKDIMHFNTVTIHRLTISGSWDNAFTDLALHYLNDK